MHSRPGARIHPTEPAVSKIDNVVTPAPTVSEVAIDFSCDDAVHGK